MSTVSHILPPDATESAPPSAAISARRPGILSVYLALMKPKIILLLLITTIGAMFVAAGGAPDLNLLLWTIIGGALSAGGANALNHYFDRDIDGFMYRTKRRPLPAGWVQPGRVIAFGISLCALAFLVFSTQVNLLAAVLSLIGALYYIFIYTLWLKRRTPHNITIGGVAGAIPPLVGWAAVTGGLAPTAWALFGIVFLWTPPHTWALTLMVQRDYARVDVPMLPVVAGEEATYRQILIYSWGYVVFMLALTPLGIFGWFYFLAALALSLLHLRDAYRIRRQRTNAAARGLYKFSLLQLALLFIAMVIDIRLP
ncbi:MAG: heme o synthase [Caldilineales bacterium]|nr:heme o synthase [Caldilineales bacterium]